MGEGSCSSLMVPIFLKESQDDAVIPGGRKVFWRFDKKKLVIASPKVKLPGS